VVAWDAVVANVAVARLVLGPSSRLRPALVKSIITMTPGTVSSDLDDARTRILVHVLDLEDSPRLVAGPASSATTGRIRAGKNIEAAPREP